MPCHGKQLQDYGGGELMKWCVHTIGNVHGILIFGPFNSEEGAKEQARKIGGPLGLNSSVKELRPPKSVGND